MLHLFRRELEDYKKTYEKNNQWRMNMKKLSNKTVCVINYTYNIFNKEDNDYNEMMGEVQVDMDETLYKTLLNENTDESSNLQYNNYQYDGFINTVDNELDKRKVNCDDWEDFKVIDAELVKVSA